MKQILYLCLFIINFQAIYAQANLAAGLVAYYPFNGNANDESGNGNNPIFNNATLTSDRNGNPKSAYQFNGKSQYMRIKNSPSINFKGAFSISAWVKVNDFYEGKCHGNRIIMKGDGDFLDGNYCLTYDDSYYTKGNNCFTDFVDKKHQAFYGPNSNYTAATEFISTSKWNLLTYTYDGTTCNLYVNCTLYGSGKNPGYRFTNSFDLFFGKLNNDQYPYWFNGIMDEVRIYKRALSEAEILALCEKKEPIVNTEPVVDFNYTVAKCNQVNFKISKSENVKSYKWDLGEKTLINKESFAYTYNNEGNYTVKLIAKGNNGKEITVSKAVLITKPTAAFTFETTPQKNTIKFNIENKQKIIYRWLFGDGDIADKEKKITHTYKQPGNYEVLLVAVNKAGCSDTAHQTISIAAPPIPTADTLITKISDTTDENSTASPLPEKRKNNILKEITVTSDSIAVSFYDNAEIDGDSVTIVYNNTVIVTHLFLTDKAKTFMLPVDKSGKSNELIMYAENLGSIPPNTALMVIYDGNKRYEVNISSTNDSNGMVVFRLRK